MATAWIYRVLLLVGAIVQSSSIPMDRILKRPFKKNTWIPLSSDTPYYDPAQSPVVPRSLHDPYQYHITQLTSSPDNWSKFQGKPPLQYNPLSSDRSQFPDMFLKIGTNIRVMDHDSHTTHLINPKLSDPKAQSRVMNTQKFHYPRISLYNQQFADSSGLSNNVNPIFSSSFENNFGNFEPFPPFKYSHSNFQFPGIYQALPSDPIVSSLEFSGGLNPKGNFGLENDNFMVRPHSPFIYPNNHHSPVKFQQFKGLNLNTFNGGEMGKPDEGYQPLSGQPQLLFSPLQQPMGKIRGSGEVVNQINVSQSGGRGQHGSGEGVVKNSYIVENSGNTHPVTSFGNGDSFELPGSSIFNDYDKTFGKYTTGSPPPRGNVIKQYHHAPVTVTNEEENNGNDGKSEYRTEEEESNSRERNNDEKERKSEYEEPQDDTRNEEHPPEESEHSEETLEVEEPEKNHEKLHPRARNSSRKSSSRDRKRYDYKRTLRPVHESDEECGKKTYAVRDDGDHESRNYQKDEPSPKASSYGHKIPHRRPS